MCVDDLYREIILDHYRSPRNKRRGVEGAIAVKHDNPLCGDELHLAVDIQGGQLADVAFDGKGCSISQASASMMTEAVQGKTVGDALGLAETIRLMMHGESPGDDLGDLMALEGVAKFPVRVKCALLAWMALKDALGQAPNDGSSDEPSPERSEGGTSMNSTINEEEVWEALKVVTDPEIGIDVVNLGLVYGIDIDRQVRQDPHDAHVDGVSRRRA